MDETNQPEAPAPRPGGRFRKGQSGNLAGRPKQPRSVKEVRQLARQHTVQMVEVLSRVALNPKSPPQARAAAASALLDRAWGKPASLDLEGAEQLVIRVVKFNDLQLEDNPRVIEHDEGQADG
jgi:Family of unknown function (DUF5681)